MVTEANHNVGSDAMKVSRLGGNNSHCICWPSSHIRSGVYRQQEWWGRPHRSLSRSSCKMEKIARQGTPGLGIRFSNTGRWVRTNDRGTVCPDQDAGCFDVLYYWYFQTTWQPFSVGIMDWFCDCHLFTDLFFTYLLWMKILNWERLRNILQVPNRNGTNSKSPLFPLSRQYRPVVKDTNLVAVFLGDNPGPVTYALFKLEPLIWPSKKLLFSKITWE